MGTGEFNAGGNPAMDWHPIQGGVEIFLVASCHGNRNKLRPDGPLGSYADFTFPSTCLCECQHGYRKLRVLLLTPVYFIGVDVIRTRPGVWN